MTQTEMAEFMDEFYEEKINKLREAGQDEYAREGGNAFANFERIASYQNRSRESVLLTYLLKHIDGICSYYEDDNKNQRENIEDRIGDAIVYLFLLAGMENE